MAEKLDQDQWEYAFIPQFADCIARVASVWARLEYDVSAVTWELADVRPALGACLTSQIFTLQNRLAALLALAKLRQLDPAIIKRINKFSEEVRVGQEIRNRIVHDQWLRDKRNLRAMGRLRITAAKKLDFAIQSIPLSELKADLEKLEKFHKKFLEIRDAIEAALPTLPEIPPSELHPIIESRWDR